MSQYLEFLRYFYDCLLISVAFVVLCHVGCLGVPGVNTVYDDPHSNACFLQFHLSKCTTFQPKQVLLATEPLKCQSRLQQTTFIYIFFFFFFFSKKIRLDF